VLGAVKASSLRSDTAFRGASDLDGACAQRVACICLMAGPSMPVRLLTSEVVNN